MKETPYTWNYYPPEGTGYLLLKQGKVDRTIVLVEGKLLIDRDKEGNVLGVEFLGEGEPVEECGACELDGAGGLAHPKLHEHTLKWEETLQDKLKEVEEKCNCNHHKMLRASHPQPIEETYIWGHDTHKALWLIQDKLNELIRAHNK